MNKYNIVIILTLLVSIPALVLQAAPRSGSECKELSRYLTDVFSCENIREGGPCQVEYVELGCVKVEYSASCPPNDCKSHTVRKKWCVLDFGATELSCVAFS